MARKLDDRPVPGDKGMPEPGPRPRMNPLGLVVVRDVLDRMGAGYTISWDQTQIEIRSLADFVAAVRFLARQSRTPVVQMALVGERLVRPIIASGMRIDLVLLGDNVSYLTRQRGFALSGNVVTWDTRIAFDIRAVLREMAARDESLPQAARR